MVTYGQNPYEDEEKRKEDKILPCQQCKPARALVVSFGLSFISDFLEKKCFRLQWSAPMVCYFSHFFVKNLFSD